MGGMTAVVVVVNIVATILPPMRSTCQMATSLPMLYAKHMHTHLRHTTRIEMNAHLIKCNNVLEKFLCEIFNWKIYIHPIYLVGWHCECDKKPIFLRCIHLVYDYL